MADDMILSFDDDDVVLSADTDDTTLVDDIPLPQGVVGPDGATDGNVAVFDGTTGKVLKDGGFSKSDVDGKLDSSLKGANNGLAELDANGKVPTSQLPCTEITDSTPGSSAIAQFPDGADGMPMRIAVGIEPVQDLHGYDNPWVGGAGKNLANPSEFASGGINATGGEASNNARVRTGYIPVTAGQSYVTSIETGKKFVAYHFYNSSKVSITENITTNPYTAPASSAFVRIMVGNNDDSNISVSDITSLQFEAGNTATSFAPYENKCPISGWDQAKVTGTGKNLLFNKLAGKNIDSNGKISTGSGYDCYVAQVFSGKKYVVSGNSDTPNGYVIAFFTSVPESGSTSYNGSRNVETSTKVFTAPIDGYVVVRSANTDTAVQIEYGEISSTYEAYKGTTITIPFTSTYYGGSVTLNKDGSADVVVDKGYAEFDGSNDESWSKGSPAYRFYISLPSATVDNDQYAKANEFKTVTTNVGAKNAIWVQSSSNRMNVFFDSNNTPSDITELKTWLSQNNLQVVYSLASPTTYHIENAGQFLSLLGVNNVWADCGNVLSVDYTADTKLYVDKKLSASQKLMELIITANREDGMKATKAYSAGNLLIVNGTLYKATTSIANGATLTVGTNVTATTVASEIAALA